MCESPRVLLHFPAWSIEAGNSIISLLFFRNKDEKTERKQKNFLLMTIDYLCLRITFAGIKHISHESFREAEEEEKKAENRVESRRKNISGDFMFQFQ